MNDQERQDLLLLYAAGALDEAQARAVRMWLAAGDPAVAGAMAEAEAVIARLSGACPPVSPDPAVKRKILANLPPKGAADRSGAGPIRLPPARPAAPIARKRGVWGRLAVAAAVGAIAAGGPLAYLTRHDRAERGGLFAEIESRTKEAAEARSAQARTAEALAQATATLSADRAALTQAKNDLAANRMLLLGVREAYAMTKGSLDASGQRLAAATKSLDDLQTALTAGDLRLTTMSKPRGNGEPLGRVIWDVPRGRWYVYIFNMSPPPDGRVYQLWLLDKQGKPIPAPTFRVDATGKAVIEVDLPKNVNPLAAAAVTDEPPGGSRAPTSGIQMVGELR
jgi:anti-sigma-K factor RskA